MYLSTMQALPFEGHKVITEKQNFKTNC